MLIKYIIKITNEWKIGEVLRIRLIYAKENNISGPLTTIHATKFINSKYLSWSLLASVVCTIRVENGFKRGRRPSRSVEIDSRRHRRETAAGGWEERKPDTQVLVLALPLTPCVTWGSSFPLSGSQFPHMLNEGLDHESSGTCEQLGEQEGIRRAMKELCYRT